MSATNYDPFEIEHVGRDGKPVSRCTALLRSMFDPVDGTCLALFRVLWGLVLAYESLTFLFHDGEKTRYMFGQPILFPFWGFEWLVPLPLSGLVTIAWLLVACGLCVAMGLLYLPALVLWQVFFAYFFLLESAFYLNHIYLLLVVNSVLIFCPLNRQFSVDVQLGLARSTPMVPRYVRFVMLSLLLIVYTYAGIVKINEDWLRAEPLRHWLPKRRNYLPFLNEEFFAYFFAYSGLVFDLLVGPMLLWSKTRPLAAFLSATFHLVNKLVFNIGIFPYMMLTSTLLFFHPSWPRMIARLPPPSPVSELLGSLVDFPRRRTGSSFSSQPTTSTTTTTTTTTTTPTTTTSSKQKLRSRKNTAKQTNEENPPSTAPAKARTATTSAPSSPNDSASTQQNNLALATLRYLHPAGWTKLPTRRLQVYRPVRGLHVAMLVLLGAFLLQQAVTPLRNTLYPGDVAWNEYGHLCSWRMKLRDKSCNAQIFAQREGVATRIDPSHYVTSRQWAKVKTRPDLFLHFAHKVAEHFPNASIHGNVKCQLNWRSAQQFIDPSYDLTKHHSFDWPLPFLTELEPLTPALMEDFPWRMPADRLWNILTFNSPFVSRDTASKTQDYSLSDLQRRRGRP